MNTLLLQPSDVLFFRDGRPMSGGLAGHGAAWPLPNVLNAAFHAALHRRGFEDHELHPHDHHAADGQAAKAARKFGSLRTAGPFPVLAPNGGAGGPVAAPGDPPHATSGESRWFFPRPADVRLCEGCDRLEISLRPSAPIEQWIPHSSLPRPLQYAVASCRPPTKETTDFAWLETTAYEQYLADDFSQSVPSASRLADRDIFLAEHTVGIGMDPATGAQDGERIYSAHYLRLRENWRLGVVTDCADQRGGELIEKLFSDTTPTDRVSIIVGGQQRLCSVQRFSQAPLRLPRGPDTFQPTNGKCFVKWVLLTPGVWPEISDKNENGEPIFDKDGKPIRPHPGGWLPNWVQARNGSLDGEPFSAGSMLLRHGIERQRGTRAKTHLGTRISARLVAAVVSKPIVVTGYALPHDAGDRPDGGAKSTHLAVPAGAVYYFETTDGDGRSAAEHATQLATALNWHGNSNGAEIKNRRSTLMGEKGFGLGVCGKWNLHQITIT